MSAPTILHAIDTWGPGGAETVCLELARGIDPARYRSIAAVTHTGWLSDAMNAAAVDVEMTPLGAGALDLTYFKGLHSIVTRRQVALIHAHLVDAAFYAATIAHLRSMPLVCTLHGTVDAAPSLKARLKLRWVQRRGRIVFVSEALRTHFRQLYGLAFDGSSVIHNGIDTDEFQPMRSTSLRKELGIGTETPLVGAIGNIRLAKAYDAWLEVAAQVRRRHPDAMFIVAGEPSEPLYGRLLRQRTALGLEGALHFLGFRDDINSILNGLDVYLSTSTSEGFSITCVQALACGVAAVATRSGGPEEIITDDVDGRLVPVGDVQAIAASVSDLISDEATRKRLGFAGRQTAVKRFSVDRMIADYESLYEVCLRQASRR